MLLVVLLLFVCAFFFVFFVCVFFSFFFVCLCYCCCCYELCCGCASVRIARLPVVSCAMLVCVYDGVAIVVVVSMVVVGVGMV